jgi:magnesium transporter
VGVTSLRQLLLSPPERTLGEIMTRSVIQVDTGTDQEEVAQLAARYDLLAIPVVDEARRLVGIVTVDDIIDIVKEEATEDFYKMVGTSDNELLYQERSFRVAGIRLPWLLVNLAGLVVTGLLLRRFQVSLKEALFLLTFVPVIMGMGGNIGSQTATITVRGLATGRIGRDRGRLRRFLWQQTKVGEVLGVACALLVAVGAFVLEQNLYYALVVGVSLFLAIVVASVNGALVPLVFERLGVDPAIASGPLVTTSNDITGILIYFGLASLLIELLVR